MVIISIFDQNFDFRPDFRFWPRISIFGQNFDFPSYFRFLDSIYIFYFRKCRNLEFCRTFQLFGETTAFDCYFEFYSNLYFPLNFWQNLAFCPKFGFSTKCFKNLVTDFGNCHNFLTFRNLFWKLFFPRVKAEIVSIQKFKFNLVRLKMSNNYDILEISKILRNLPKNY